MDVVFSRTIGSRLWAILLIYLINQYNVMIISMDCISFEKGTINIYRKDSKLILYRTTERNPIMRQER